MTYLSTGDLTIVYQLRNAGSQAKTTMNRLSQEMTTGIKSDLGQAVTGNLNALSALESSLSRLDSYDQVIRQTTTTLTVVQSALSYIQTTAQKLGTTLTQASYSAAAASSEVALAQAEPALENILSSLNMRQDSRYVFSGVSSQNRPFQTAQNLMDSIIPEMSGATQSSEILEKIDSWMTDNVMYGGATTEISNIKISDRDATSIPITGNDPALLKVLKGLMIASVASHITSPSDQETRQALMSESGNILLEAEGQLSVAIGKVGINEAQVADAALANAAERTATQLARSSMIEADPYETATALQAIETQLETLYTLTSRISRLTLTNYL